MEFHFDDDALEELAESVARTVERVLNDAISDAQGLPLGEAVRLVHGRLAAAGVEPNDEDLREKLAELGFA